MPFLTSTPVVAHDHGATVAAPGNTRGQALAQVRAALSMITADPYARGLLAGGASRPGAADEAALADWLYARWWCGPGLRTVDPAVADSATSARGAAGLEAARRTVAPASQGWLVLAAVSDVLVAARLPFEPDDAGSAAHPKRRLRTTTDAVVTSSRPGLPPRPGDLVTLRLGEAGLDPTGGWWWAHSGRPEDVTATALDRWYVHARDLAAAGALVPLLLRCAAEAACPISLKCSPAEAGYGRRDALVVYLPRTSARAAEAALLRHAAAVAPLVHPDVPPLTRTLLPGVARAEDPGSSARAEDDPKAAAAEVGVSYGQLRCRQVADVAGRLLKSDAAENAASDADLAAALADVGMDVDAVERVP